MENLKQYSLITKYNGGINTTILLAEHNKDAIRKATVELNKLIEKDKFAKIITLLNIKQDFEVLSELN